MRWNRVEDIVIKSKMTVLSIENVDINLPRGLLVTAFDAISADIFVYNLRSDN